MNKLAILDRDGVINQMVIDAEHGTIDSPLHPDQVELIPGVPDAIRELRTLGFKICIATNQPAAAKGKTTHANLEAVHQKILAQLEEAGAPVASSHICWHAREEGCSCRKPKPGLLHEALRLHSSDPRASWMVGDGVTDVEAGVGAGVRTIYLGPEKCDMCKCFAERGLSPDFRFANLLEFVRTLAREKL